MQEGLQRDSLKTDPGDRRLLCGITLLLYAKAHERVPRMQRS